MHEEQKYSMKHDFVKPVVEFNFYAFKILFIALLAASLPFP